MRKWGGSGDLDNNLVFLKHWEDRPSISISYLLARYSLANDQNNCLSSLPKDFLCLDTSLSCHSENSSSSFKTQVKCCPSVKHSWSPTWSELPAPTCFSWHAVPAAIGTLLPRTTMTFWSAGLLHNTSWVPGWSTLLCVPTAWLKIWHVGNKCWMTELIFCVNRKYLFHLFIPSTNNFLITYHVASIPSTV